MSENQTRNGGCVPRRKTNIPSSEIPEIIVNAPSVSTLSGSTEGPGLGMNQRKGYSGSGDHQSSSKNLNEIKVVGKENGAKGEDDIKPVSEISQPRRLPRKNSISLPNLDDMEYLKKQVEIRSSEVSMNSSEFGNIDGSDDETTPINKSVPIKNYRRKSVTEPPPKMLKPPVDDDDSRSTSPANSVASVNSLASLLKEKMQMFPNSTKKRKPKDYKIRAFVGFLFLTIVALVGLAYILYQQQVLRRAYFEKIKFSQNDRVINIYNNEGVEVLRGRLGTTLDYNKAFPCLHTDEKPDGSICLEWMNHARLYMNTFRLYPDTECYNFQWVSLSEEIAPTDCFDLSPRTGHWYGGGQMAEDAWPLEKGLHNFAPFVTGATDKYEWGNVLKRFFINSKGAAVIVDSTVPLYTAINVGPKAKELCFEAKYDDFAYVNRITPFPFLNYSVCTGPNMTRLHSLLAEKSLWDGLKQDDMNIIHSLVTEPLWEITTDNKQKFTEEAVLNYTEDVIGLGFLKQGHVLLNGDWQKQPGDFEVDTERFPTLEETINIMHRRGFRIVFSIQSFISTESASFAETVRKQLLVSERFTDKRIPALTRYRSIPTAGVLDVTNDRTVPWLLRKLKAVRNKYKFDAFYLDLGVAYDMPHYYQSENPLTNPDHYKTFFINNLQGNVPIFGVSGAVQRPQVPAFVSLPEFESSWDGIRKVIPTVLTYGIIGYPFLIPGAVGGDYEISEYNSKTDTNSTADVLLPDKDLYMRWLQLATFLPVIRYRHLPSKYGDDKVLELAKVLTSLRQKVVTPLLKKYASEALDSGLPMIRPLWMLGPNDPACHIVTDEFSVGEELIVAPVLYSGSRQREVYLPAGVWKDGIDGSLRKGNRWIHDYVVEEHQIAYFERMPDNTRF